MAGYERKSLQVLGGGYNALISVDKVPNTDYLLAQNWRSDALGRLISRPGYPSAFAIPGAGLAHSAATLGGVGDPYYVAANSAIVDPACSVYYDGTLLASGFDGDRVGFASQNGFVYVMNRGNQGRHTPSPPAGVPAWQTWNLAAPPAAPVAAVGATPAVATNVTYTIAWQGNVIDVSIPVGLQTVTPLSMVGIFLGMNLGVSNVDYSNYEVVTVTAVTSTTFTATFTTTKTGPTILAAFTDYVHFLTIAGVTYSFSQNGYSQAQIPGLLAGLASADPNCTVSYPGTGQDIVITALIPFIAVTVSGSDDNPTAYLAPGAVTNLPTGTYRYYLTFMSADFTLESNPSSVSKDPVTVAGQAIAITIPAADAPADPRIGFVNVYRDGGTQGAAYRVASVPSTVGAPAVLISDSMPDSQATNNGQMMPIDHGAPPACAGIIGPHFSRLYAWSDAAHVNRLYYTKPNLPQYWNTDEQVGDWVEVGLEGENIVWASIHTNLLVVYKERSIWMLIGDPATGTLEQVYDGVGLANAFALAPAGQIDYFIGSNGLHLFDMSQVHVISGNILPLFNQNRVNAGPLTPPGAVLPGTAFNSRSMSSYAVALGHALGRLYVTYAEKTTGAPSFNLLVFDEGPEPERNAFLAAQRSGRWFYHRHRIAGTLGGFFGFYFDGVAMLGLTGAAGGAAQGFSLSDFRGFLTADAGGVAIECVYQSHYEDCGAPDNDKQWLEVAVDYEFAAGATANVSVGFNNGAIAPAAMGTLTAGPRRTQSFAFQGAAFPEQQDAGVLARNLSVLIDVTATGLAVIHNVYLFFYQEARLALVASTIPTDLGVGKVKECKELELDIDASAGMVLANIVSDLPGNALAVRAGPVVQQGGRAIRKYPFPTQQGLLWQVALLGLAGMPFRLYAARLLMRVIGVYVEAYESAAGFVWDSMETALGNADTQTFDQLRFEMDTDPAPATVYASLVPGPPKLVASAVLSVTSSYDGGTGYGLAYGVITLGAVGLFAFSTELRRDLGWAKTTDTFTLDAASLAALQAGTLNLNFSIDGTVFGDADPPATFTLYAAQLDVVYADAMTATLPATSSHVTPGTGTITGWTITRGHFSGLGFAAILGLSNFGYVSNGIFSASPFVPNPVPPPPTPVTVEMSTDLPGEAFRVRGTFLLATGHTARAWVTVPLPEGIEGRSVRLRTTGACGYRLYTVQVRSSSIGRYLAGSTPSGNDDTFQALEYDFRTERRKAFKRVEIDLRADGRVDVEFITDQDGARIAPVYHRAIWTPNGRTAVLVVMPPGIRGRLLRLRLTSTQPARVYRLRVWSRTLNDPVAEWAWAEFPVEETSVLSTWTDILIDKTPSVWTWTDIDLQVQSS